MQSRNLGGRRVSEIGLGTWQLGGTDWGPLSEDDGLATLAAAAAAGVRFIDTADMYGAGRSEALIGRFLRAREDRREFFVATKFGRSPHPGWPHNFHERVIRAHVEGSLARLGTPCLDLLQTHCIPGRFLEDGKVFALLRRLRDEGTIAAFGASVERVEDARAMLEVEGLASLQVIFNLLRRKLADELFPLAAARGIAIIVRLPLASGVLAAKYHAHTRFEARDHRSYNKDGDAFYVGETFGGLPLPQAVAAVDELRPWIPPAMSPAAFALRFCLDFEAVTTVIPGARTPAQARANASATELPSLSPELHERLRRFYVERVEPRIRGEY